MFAGQSWADEVAQAISPFLGSALLEIYYDTPNSTGAVASFDAANEEIPRSPNAPLDQHPRARMEAAVGLIIARSSFAVGITERKKLSTSLERYAWELGKPQASLVTPQTWRSNGFQSSYGRKTDRIGETNRHQPPNQNVLLTMPLRPDGRTALESWVSTVVRTAGVSQSN